MKQTKNDRKYMQIAIDEMMQSRSEHKTKKDPMVGAVIVDAHCNELGRIHRGKLRVGDHAEYALIDKKLKDQDLEGSTLYVTLEPCTSRSSDKTPCAERIVTARIRKVFIGMTDPNPDIEGHGIAFLHKNGVDVEFFDKKLSDQIRNENKDFIDHYDEIKRVTNDSEEEFEGPSSREKEIIVTSTTEDLMNSVISDYLTLRNKTINIPSPELWDFFCKNGFLELNPETNSYLPTIAGLLLFGEAPEDFLHCKVKLEAHIGTVDVSDNIGGPILLLPNRIKDFLDKYMRTYTEIREFERVKIPEYPWEALREAIINAIVHRDYTEEGTHIFVNMYQDHIEIKSPGLPLKPITLEKIRAYNAPTYNRNPRIADTFNYMNLMEERGWGFKKMRDILKEHGLPAPEFNYDNGYFVVTISAKIRELGIFQIAPNLLKKLTKRQRKIINYIIEEGRITSSECSKIFKVGKTTAKKELKTLTDFAIIERKGIKRTIHYVLRET